MTKKKPAPKKKPAVTSEVDKIICEVCRHADENRSWLLKALEGWLMKEYKRTGAKATAATLKGHYDRFKASMEA